MLVRPQIGPLDCSERQAEGVVVLVDSLEKHVQKSRIDESNTFFGGKSDRFVICDRRNSMRSSKRSIVAIARTMAITGTNTNPTMIHAFHGKDTEYYSHVEQYSTQN